MTGYNSLSGYHAKKSVHMTDNLEMWWNTLLQFAFDICVLHSGACRDVLGVSFMLPTGHANGRADEPTSSTGQTKALSWVWDKSIDVGAVFTQANAKTRKKKSSEKLHS